MHLNTTVEFVIVCENNLKKSVAKELGLLHQNFPKEDVIQY